MSNSTNLGTEKFGRSFSHPLGAGDEADWSNIQLALLKTVAGRVRSAATAQSQGRAIEWFEGELEPVSNTLRSDTDVWLPELSFVLSHCRSGRAEAATTQFALVLRAAGGQEAQWSFPLAEPTELVFGGILFVAEGILSVQGSDSRTRITFAEGAESEYLDFVKVGNLWCLIERSTFNRIQEPYLIQGERIGLYINGFRAGDDPTERLPLLELSRALPLDDFQGQIGLLTRGVEVLEGAGPAYSQWVARTVKMIQMLDARRDIADPVYTSASWPNRPAIVSMGFSKDAGLFNFPFRVADALVHEASHQYLNILSVAYPLANGEDTGLYYSALARRERPIDRVLLAFHAAANMTLFYAEAMKRGATECAYNFKWSAECATSLREPLDATAGLTDVGQGVFRPLASALDRMDSGLLANV